MGRFTQSPCTKGSQKCIQILVNDKTDLLNSKIWSSLDLSEEHIEWLSPLRNYNYAEYRDRAFLKRLDDDLESMPLAQFWPRGGPQWDALGRSSSRKLFLIEAKSNIPELLSSLHARDKESI